MDDRMAVYTVRERNDKKFWCRIGSCWPNKDGNGFSVKLDATPLDGQLVIRKELPKDDRDSPPIGRRGPPARGQRDFGDADDDTPF